MVKFLRAIEAVDDSRKIGEGQGGVREDHRQYDMGAHIGAEAGGMMSAKERTNRPADARSGRMVVPDVVWSPLATGGLILAVGLLGLVLDKPWLFPSLAPTAFLQLQSPKHPSSRPYNTTVEHLVGLAAGCLAAWLLGADRAPGVLASHELTWPRLGAAALGMALTMLGTLLARAPHPPAAATTLLITEGSYKLRGEDLLLVLIGVALTAALGEGLRQVRLRYLPPPPDPGSDGERARGGPHSSSA